MNGGITLIKILQFAIASSQGGYTQYVTNIWRSMNKDKIHFDFVTFSKTIDFAEEFIRSSCKVHQISVYPEEDLQRFIDEFEKVLDCGYDIIEIHTSFWKNTIVEQLAKERNVKAIVHAHSTGISKARNAEEEKRLLEKHLKIKANLSENLADYYFACSESAADWLFGGVIPAEKVQIIHNTIDTSRFAFNRVIRQQMREALRLEGKFVLGHVGRLERVKNQGFLIEILAEINKQIENTVLLMVGDGSQKEYLKKKAEFFGVSDAVIFVGKKTDTERYYQAMDIFLLPSLMEGVALVLLEAQCSGLKCLCSEGIPEEGIVTDKIQRLPLCDREQWVEEIIKETGIHGREDESNYIKKQGYDTNEQIKMIEGLYESMM